MKRKYKKILAWAIVAPFVIPIVIAFYVVYAPCALLSWAIDESLGDL